MCERACLRGRSTHAASLGPLYPSRQRTRSARSRAKWGSQTMRSASKYSAGGATEYCRRILRRKLSELVVSSCLPWATGGGGGGEVNGVRTALSPDDGGLGGAGAAAAPCGNMLLPGGDGE